MKIVLTFIVLLLIAVITALIVFLIRRDFTISDIPFFGKGRGREYPPGSGGQQNRAAVRSVKTKLKKHFFPEDGTGPCVEVPGLKGMNMEPNSWLFLSSRYMNCEATNPTLVPPLLVVRVTDSEGTAVDSLIYNDNDVKKGVMVGRGSSCDYIISYPYLSEDGNFQLVYDIKEHTFEVFEPDFHTNHITDEYGDHISYFKFKDTLTFFICDIRFDFYTIPYYKQYIQKEDKTSDHSVNGGVSFRNAQAQKSAQAQKNTQTQKSTQNRKTTQTQKEKMTMKNGTNNKTSKKRGRSCAAMVEDAGANSVTTAKMNHRRNENDGYIRTKVFVPKSERASIPKATAEKDDSDMSDFFATRVFTRAEDSGNMSSGMDDFFATQYFGTDDQEEEQKSFSKPKTKGKNTGGKAKKAKTNAKKTAAADVDEDGSTPQTYTRDMDKVLSDRDIPRYRVIYRGSCV